MLVAVSVLGIISDQSYYHLQPFLTETNMVKILTCGDVLGNWSPLLARLDELQRSKHGPFDVLLIAGKCFKDKNQYESVAPSIQLPLKTYVFNPFGFPTNSNDTNIENLVIVSKESLGITTLLESGLTVSFFIGDSLETVATEMKNINSIANAPGFRGCDVLITSEWPREMHHFLSSTELDELKSTNISIGSGSKGPVELALILKPRYHFVSGMGSYFQRSPYSNNSSGRPAPCTRLIAVDKVSESKDKAKKWLHAIAIPPITHMSPEEIAELPQGCTDCPYVEVGGSKGKRSADDAYGTAKKMKFSDSIPASTASGAFFFGDKGTAGPGGPSDANSQSASCKSLFIGGLSREMTDFELKNALPNAIVVKRPSGKAFAFVDFASHEAALKVLETSARRGLVVSGKTLTVGWAKEKPGVSSSAGGIEVLRNDEDIVYERQLVPPTSTATVLFFGGLPTTLVPHASSPGVSLTDSDKNGDVDFVKEFNDFLQIDSIIAVAKLAYKSYAYVQFQDYNDAMAIISKSINEKISMGGKALTIGWAKDDIDSMNLSTNNTNMITKQPYPTANVLFVGGIHRNVIDADVSAVFYSEKVTSVKRPEGKDYAFVEFASPYEAQHAITRCSKQEYILQGTKLVFGWAKGRAADILTESADCWFCLASPSVKVN